MDLVVTGSVGIDTIETPDEQRVENLLGGSCAYFAAAASFYTRPGIVAVVGSDFPAEHRALLEAFNIDTKGLEVREGRTFRWGGRYHENMDERDTLFTELNVLGGESPRVPPSYQEAPLLFLANAPPAVQHAFLQHFPRRELVVADTMNLWIQNEKEALLKLLKEVDGLVLNEEEAEQLTGLRNTVAAAKELLTYGPSFVVVKKGEHGCLFAHKEGIGALPAYPAERVLDPTGAGDTFAGGLLGFLAAKMNGTQMKKLTFDILKRALLHATIMSSFTIEAFSLDRLQRLTKGELAARVREYERMLHL